MLRAGAVEAGFLLPQPFDLRLHLRADDFEIVLALPGVGVQFREMAAQLIARFADPQWVPRGKQQLAAAATPTGEGAPSGDYVDVTSPFVGSFYRSPSPDTLAFVDVEDGIRSLYPAQNGRVVAVPAREGVEVPEGALLLQVDDTLAKAQLSEAEIAEVLIHTAVYAGVPAANAAFAIARRVLAEEDRSP